MNVALLILTQAIYSLSDLGKKVYAEKLGFGFGLLKNIPFLLVLIVPAIALALQIYVLSRYELSKTMITLGVLNVVFATLLGVGVLKEKLSLANYLGIVFAILAVILLNIKK